MKILIFRTDPSIMNITTYNSQEIGLARAYTELGHQCDIVYYNGKNESKVQTIDAGNGKEIQIFWMKGFSILNNGIFPGITKLVKQYDVIQVSEYYFWGSWYIYKRFRKKKQVYIYQGVYDADNSKKYKIRCKVMDPLLLNRQILEEVPVFTKSNLAMESMKRRGFQKVKTVGVGLDTARFQMAEGARRANQLFHKDNSLHYLLYIGVLEDRRNILFMLDVLKKLTDEKQNIRLVIVGRGKEEYVKRCKEKVQDLGLGKYIIYKDRLQQEELIPVYRDCDLFLLPTKYEIYGMVLMEAITFGLPVISSYNGGSSTVIQPGVNGDIVMNYDIDEWKGCITEWLSDSNRLKKTNSVESLDMSVFSWSSIAETILDTLRKDLR